MGDMSDKTGTNRTISPKQKTEDQSLDSLLRPQFLEHFTGQEKLKTNLKILIEAAKV